MYYSDVQWCINVCNILGVNPLKKNDIIQHCLFLFWLLSIFGSMFFTILMLISNEEMLTVKNLTSVTTNLLMLPHGILKYLTLFHKKSSIRVLINDTKDSFWKSNETAEIQRSQKFARFLKNIFFYCVVLSIASTLIKPFVVGERASGYQKYRPYFLPRYFFLVLEDIACTIGIISMACLDVIICVLLMMAEAQFRMLNQKLKSLFDFDNETGRCKEVLHTRIKECVDHQNFLIEFLNRFSSTFSITTLFYLGDIILIMCMRMFIIFSGNTHINYRIEALFHLIGGLNEIVLCYSIPAQALMDQAAEISKSAYFSKWYEYPNEAKSILQIMVRDQRRIEITAGGFVMIDLKMFMAAVKTIISYCMFLRTMGLAKN